MPGPLQNYNGFQGNFGELANGRYCDLEHASPGLRHDGGKVGNKAAGSKVGREL